MYDWAEAQLNSCVGVGRCLVSSTFYIPLIKNLRYKLKGKKIVSIFFTEMKSMDVATSSSSDNNCLKQRNFLRFPVLLYLHKWFYTINYKGLRLGFLIQPKLFCLWIYVCMSGLCLQGVIIRFIIVWYN